MRIVLSIEKDAFKFVNNFFLTISLIIWTILGEMWYAFINCAFSFDISDIKSIFLFLLNNAEISFSSFCSSSVKFWIIFLNIFLFSSCFSLSMTEVFLDWTEDKDNVKYVKKTIKEIKKKCPKYVIDLCVKLLVTEKVCDNIDKLNDVQYGNEIKSIVVY